MVGIGPHGTFLEVEGGLEFKKAFADAGVFLGAEERFEYRGTAAAVFDDGIDDPRPELDRVDPQDLAKRRGIHPFYLGRCDREVVHDRVVQDRGLLAVENDPPVRIYDLSQERIVLRQFLVLPGNDLEREEPRDDDEDNSSEDEAYYRLTRLVKH